MKARRKGRGHWRAEKSPARSPLNGCVALLVIDNAPLQAAAWAELVRARKRLEKASREIHRHEEIDEPGYGVWLARVFPTLVSRVRELAQQLESKQRIVEAVESQAYFTGRRPAVVWREMQAPRSEPEFVPPGAQGRGRSSWDAERPDEDSIEEELKRLFERDKIEEDDPLAGAFRDVTRTMFGFGPANGNSPEEADARAIYRRLVQQLHPDRGGAWTPARARLWEQVQQAWQEHDADWLARLEAEWEASAELLGPTSAIGRLRAACRELDAARRDAERRLRGYRKTAWWRFSLREPTAELREWVGRHLREDEQRLQRALDAIEATIASWEKARSSRKSGGKRAVSVAWQDEMPLF